jgi:Na+-transporting NADH:ubiquinone oxidoreductase subunit NqrA
VILQGLWTLLTTTPAVKKLLGAPTNVFFSLAQKQALAPYVVLHVVNAPSAENTLDGSSALTEGEIQFDCYANDQPTARTLAQTVRNLVQDFTGALPDGTVMQFSDVTMNADDPYELGGGGYVFRAILRVRALYTETS